MDEFWNELSLTELLWICRLIFEKVLGNAKSITIIFEIMMYDVRKHHYERKVHWSNACPCLAEYTKTCVKKRTETWRIFGKLFLKSLIYLYIRPCPRKQLAPSPSKTEPLFCPKKCAMFWNIYMWKYIPIFFHFFR